MPPIPTGSPVPSADDHATTPLSQDEFVSDDHPHAPHHLRSHLGEPKPPALPEADHADVVTLRVLLNSKGAGVVIGKGGKTVEELREYSGCKAGVSKACEGVNDRILTIVGSVHQVADAMLFLAKTLVATPCMTFQPPLPADQTMVRLLIPNAVMGSIIGRAGQRIKQIQEKNGVRLVASKECLPHSSERVSDITGDPSAIRGAALDIAQSLLDEWERIASSTVLYDPRVRQRTGNSGPLPSSMLHQQHHHHHQQQHDMLAPTPEGAYGRHPAYTAGLASHNGSPQPYGAPRNPPPPVASRFPLRTPRPDYIPKSDDPNAITQTMGVPADLVGCIIGKGGARIAEIRKISGSKVSISKEPNENGERIFTLVGLHAQNELAISMLCAQLQEEKDRREREQQHQQQAAVVAAAAVAHHLPPPVHHLPLVQE